MVLLYGCYSVARVALGLMCFKYVVIQLGSCYAIDGVQVIVCALQLLGTCYVGACLF